MCGIIGYIKYKSFINMDAMMKQLSHRGPNDRGSYNDDYISFGHVRLSIQDLSTNGHQPMFSQDERYLIIFNGEIYNHWEIRDTLKDKYVFKSTSDTETILYGYIEHGIKIFNLLNGIFALAIYDQQTHDIIIVRDQFGVKPLYYHHQDGRFAFSSELKTLVDLPNFDKSLDSKALVNYIHFLWCPEDKTPFQQAKKLEAGHLIQLNAKAPNKFVIQKYYEIPFNGQYSLKTEKELIDELDKKLFNAVKRQLLSDVPVGFFLSGGLDSSAVVAMAKKAMPDKKLKCFTIDSGEIGQEGFTDDLHYAKLVAKHLDVELEIVEAKSNIIADFDKMIYHLDEPQADTAPLHVLNICKQAQAIGYMVLLGGTAGDDLFSGYKRHQALQIESSLEKTPLFIRRSAKNLLGLLSNNNPIFRRTKKLFANAEKTQLERMAGYFGWIDLLQNKRLFTPEIRKLIENYNPSDILIDSLKNIPQETNILNQMLFWEMKYFLTDHNLNYTDKLSMAVGVEVRVPFLDKELVEFSVTIPPELKLKGQTTKYILKKVMERYLPQEVIYRPKTGFGAPVRHWILNDLKPMIESRLSKKNIQQTGIFDFESLQTLIADNQKGKIDASYTILSVLAIQSWYNQFVINDN